MNIISKQLKKKVNIQFKINNQLKLIILTQSFDVNSHAVLRRKVQLPPNMDIFF